MMLICRCRKRSVRKSKKGFTPRAQRGAQRSQRSSLHKANSASYTPSFFLSSVIAKGPCLQQQNAIRNLMLIKQNIRSVKVKRSNRLMCVSANGFTPRAQRGAQRSQRSSLHKANSASYTPSFFLSSVIAKGPCLQQQNAIRNLMLIKQNIRSVKVKRSNRLMCVSANGFTPRAQRGAQRSQRSSIHKANSASFYHSTIQPFMHFNLSLSGNMHPINYIQLLSY